MKDNYLPLVKRWLQIPLLLAVLLLSFTPGNTGVAHAVNCYTLTLASDPVPGGDIIATPAPDCNGGTQYSAGTPVQLQAELSANYVFAGWSGALSGWTNPVTITMDADKTVTAKFFADRWQEAPPISVPFSFAGLTELAAQDNVNNVADPSPCYSAGNPDPRDLRTGWASVWFKYTPLNNELVFFDTLGSTTNKIIFGTNPPEKYAYDTYIAVWTGTPDKDPLTATALVGCNDDNNSTASQSQLSLNVAAGVTYYIQVGQFNGFNYEPPQDPGYNGGNLRFNVSRFQDVPGDYWARDFIERLYLAGVTSGCNTNPLMYCPTATVTRDQMAIFLLRGKYGSGYTPPAPSGVFQDVPTNYWAAAWIEKLAVDGITLGCSVTPKLYCPTLAVTRDQMAIFLLRAKHGAGYTPPAPSGVFQDVPTNYWAAAWIEQLAAEGITSGCSVTPKLYCPTATVTRDQMAVFLVRNFNLP